MISSRPTEEMSLFKFDLLVFGRMETWSEEIRDQLPGSYPYLQSSCWQNMYIIQ